MKYTVKMIEDLSNQRTPVASNTRKRTKKGALSVSDIEALRDDEQDMIELERQRNEERLRRIEEERKRREAEIEALREREEQNQRQFDIRAAKEERDADKLVTNQLKRDFSAPDDSAKKASTYQKYKEVMTQDLNNDYDPYLNAVKANGSRQGFARDVDTANFIKNLANRLSATGNTATTEDGLKTANQELSRLTDDERKLLMDYVRAGKDATRDLNSMIGGASAKRDYDPLATINVNKAKFLRSTGMSEDDFKRYQEYAQFVSDYEDRTKTQEEIKNKTNTGNKAKDLANAAGYTALDVALSPVEGIQALAGSFRQPKDSRMPVNTNNELYRLHNVSRDIENQVNQNIDEFYGTNDKAAKLAKFAYNTGVSIGKAGMAMAIGGTVGEAAGGLGASEGVARTAANLATLPQFGATSFASTFQDAQDRGLTKGQAYSLATVSGLAEMGTEVFSLDHFWDIAKKSGSQAAKSALADWLVQASIEGSEEVASDVINEIADRAIAGDKSEYENNVKDLMEADPSMSEEDARKTATYEMLKEWIQDFAGGAVSGSVFGGVHFTSNAVQAKKLFADGNYKEFAESIDTDKNSYASEEDYKTALSAKEKAEALAEKQEAGKKITVDDKVTLNNLLGETMAAAQNKIEESENTESQQSENVISETTQGQQSQKITLEDVPTLYDGQTTHEATVNGNTEEITAKEAYLYGAQGLDLQSDSQAIQTAYEAGQGRLEDIRAEEEIKRDVPESIITENTSIPETTIEDVPEQFKSGQTYAAEENGEEIEISAADAYIMGANGDTLDTEIPELKLAYNEGVQKRTKIASEQKIAPVQLKEAKAKDLSGNIFTVKGITEDKNTIMLETSNGEIPASEVTFQNNAVQTLYNNAVAQATPRLSNAYIEYYNPGTPVATYNIAFNRFKNAGALGAKSFEATLKKNKYLADLMGEDNAKEVYSLGAEERKTEKKEEKKARKAKGRITDNRKTKEENDPLYNIAKQMAYVTGQDIEITDDLDSQINGEFQKSAAKIILNANNDNMWQTFFHEAVGEFSEAWNENGMKEVQDEILNWFIDEYGQKAIEDKIAVYQKAYREVEGEKAYREAANEFVNDSLSGLFSTPEGMQDFADWLYKNETQTKAESILERIANIIKKLIDSVKEYLNTHKSMSDASREIMLMEADRAAGLRARLFDVMEEARKNYEANATEEEAEGKTTPNVEKPTTSFSLKTPVEESGDLIAVHNITQEQLMKTIDLGGFPMPSIAITKAAMGHDMYGDISVVFNKDTIDPKNNKNRVYGGDAWTPTFPRVEVKINEKVSNRIRERINKLITLEDQRTFESVDLDDATLEDRINGRRGDAIDAYKNNKGLQYAFLKEKGIDLNIPTEDARLNNKFTNDQIIAATKVIKSLKEAEALRMGFDSYEKNPELVEELRKTLNEQFREKYKSSALKSLANKELYEDLPFSDFDHITAGVYKYYKDGIQQQMDHTAARDMLKGEMAKHEKEYLDWLENLFKGIVEKTGLRNNKELFTYSGNRRSWETLHDDYTLDNIVKIMSQLDERGEAAFFSQNAIQALSTKKFKNLDEIRKSKGQLRLETEEEHEKRIEEQSQRFSEIVDEIKDNTEKNGFSAYMRASDVIAEVIKNHRTVQSIDRALREYRGLNIQKDTAQKIVDLMKDIGENPTGYFEAKPRRAVGFDEIAEVVLPDTADQELIKGLEDNNIPYATYKEGNEEDRKAKLNAIDDAKFSVKVDNRGRELTKDQQKYFKDSKLRDEEGRLKVMYHGAEEANYTIFDPQFSDDATSLFFTDNHYVAAGYAGTEDYVDLNNIRKKGSIKTLKDLEKRFEDTDYRVREENGEYIIEDIEDPEDPVVFIRGNSIEEVYNDFVQDFVWNGENGEYGGVYRVYLNATNPLVIDANGNNWNNITWEPEDKSPVYGPLTTTRGIAAYGKAHGYDSVIINNVKDNGYYASDNEPSQIAIVFNSNQIKSIDNEHPSEDEDIRYSLNMLDAEYDTALKNNNMEAANALVRRAANEAGYNSPALYHGTLDFGFTQIDLDKMDDKISFFATDTLSMASSYSGTQEERSISEDSKISEENIVDKLKELHRWKDIRQFKAGDEKARYDYLKERFKRISSFAKEHERDLRERGLLDAYRDFSNTLAEQILFKNFDDKAINQKLRPLRDARYVISDYAWDIQNALLPLRREGMRRNVYMLDGIPKTEENVREYLPDEHQGIYKLYGNLDNMLSIDGKGHNWNNIKVNGEGLSTREISKRAKELGYNGVIIRNITDDGGRNNAFNHYVERGNVYIFFDPRTQVKSGDAVTYDGNGNVIPLSERFNPENNDIRYSLSGIDDTLFDHRKYSLSDWELWSSSFDVTDEDLKNTFIGDETVSDDPDYATRKAEQVISNILTKVNENFKGQKVSSETIERIARNVKKKAGSGATIDDLKNNLTKIFDWMQNSREVDYREAVEYIAQSVAPVIENTKTTNPQEQKDYDDLKKAIRARKIKLTPEQKKEVSAVYGSWKDFFGQAGGLLTIDDKNGVSTDSIWSDLVEAAARSGQILDLEAPDVSQPIELLELMKNAAPQLVTDYGGNLEEASMNLAMDILADYYEAEAEAIRQNTRESMLSDTEAGKEAIKAVNKAKAQLNNEAKAYKEKVREAYQKKYEAQKKMLESLKRDNEELQRSNSVWYGKYKELSEKQIDAQAAKTASRKSVKDYIDTQEARKQRDNIAKIGWQMVERLTRPTDKKHIPDALKMPITDFLSSIDFIPERARLDSKNTLRWQDAMRNLSDMLAHADQEHADLEGSDIQSIMDPELSYQMSKFAKEHEGEKVTSLDGQALKQLSKIMKSLQALMNKSNEFFANEQFKHIDDAGKATIDTLYERENLPSMGEVKEKVYNLTSVDMLEPISYFKEMGDAPLSIYKEFRTGMDTRIKRITDTGEYFKEITKGIDVSTWTGDKADVHEFKISNFGTQEEPTILRLTTAQIMSLYESMKRDQAKHHAIIGGITAEDITTKKGLKKNTIRKSRPVHITPMEYHKIISVLTPEQIKLADEMQKYMANDCAKWGNEVTMKLYGYKKFTDKNYFPIKVDDNTIQTTDRTENKNTSINAIRNMSASKDLTPKANNALVIRDIFDVFSDHVTDMATYEGYCLPVADALRWFNYQEKDVHTGYRPDNENSIQTRNSVKEEIDRVYGSHMKQYFVNLIRDINGEKAKTYSTNFEWLVGNYKAAAVGANVRVAIQQPTAYTRAAYMMDTKYLTRALADSIHAPKYSKEAIEKSMIAKWKSEGYYETSLGHTTKQMITGIETPMDKIQDATGILAQLGDDLTWGMIYHAVQLETKDKTNFSPGTKAFDDAVVERFNNVIDETQVVDSVLHKSQIMRDQNALVKMATAFMAEPTKSYNMMHRSFMSDKLGTSKNTLKKAVAVFVTNSLFTAAAASIVDAFRKDDDETPWIERYLEALIGYDVLTDDDKSLKDKIKAAVFSNVGSGLNPLNLMPYAKDIMSTLEGYDTARMDTAGLASFYTALTQTAKYATGESNKTLYGVIKSDARAAAQLTGIPFYNALREFETVYNAISKENLIASTGRTSAYAPVYKAIEKDGDIQAEVNNVIEDKKKEKITDDMTPEQKAETEKKIRSAVKSSLTTKYKAQMVELYGKDKTAAAELKTKLIQAYMAAGDTREDANNKINKWIEP